MTPKQAINAVADFFESEAQLCEQIRFSQGAWVRAKRLGRLPPEMCVNIEVATDGAITRAILRPDIFGPEARLIKNSWRRNASRR